MNVNAVILEKAVLTKTPQEVAEFCKNLSEGEYSARALGLACRFRGLEYVKALTETGATFDFAYTESWTGRTCTLSYWLAPLEINWALRHSYYISNRDSCFSNAVVFTDPDGDPVGQLNPLPLAQRMEIVRYLCENSERLHFYPEAMLFYSIVSNNKTITSVLKGMGVTLSEDMINILTNVYWQVEVWNEFVSIAQSSTMSDEEYVEVIDNIIGELGGKMLNFDYIIDKNRFKPNDNIRHVLQPDMFKYILAHFDQKKMNKGKIMKTVIDAGSVKCLEVCAENGWLRLPRKRDEIIEYAAQAHNAECTAWLLEFKNRTADLAKERRRAEKRDERILNAAPDSALMMGKLWSWQKQEDGTLVITRYKGTHTEIEVPSTIGKNVVTAIGDHAFSPKVPRIKQERRYFMKNIKAVKLPNTIRKIGNGAFCGCEKLSKFEMLEGVVEIGDEAFKGCGELTDITVSETVKKIGRSAFGNCKKLSEFEIPGSVEEIGDEAFICCGSLTELIVPEAVKKIGSGVFAGCCCLHNVKLPESMNEIGDYMFTECDALNKIDLPVNIKRIGKEAFSQCERLERIEIPDGVVIIDEDAFTHCNSLKIAVIPASVTIINNHVYKLSGPSSVFIYSKDVTAIVEPNSYAEKYCKGNKIKFRYKE